MAKKRLFPKKEGTPLENFTPIASITDLEVIDVVAGNGQTVQPGDRVRTHYTGALAESGIVFQSSHDSGNPITFGLDEVIVGWQEGLPGMKVGGTRRLLIPAEKAYGSRSPSKNIPAHADLVFDIELIDIK